MKIEELGPPDADHSTGLILRWRDRLLFALEDRRNWRDRGDAQVARLIGIGGHLEPGETWAQAVKREAREEAGVGIDLLEREQTLLFRGEGQVSDITAELECPPPHPLFIWSTIFCFGRPPNVRAIPFVNPVFLATAPADAEPNPGMEVPGILAITETQLLQAAASSTTIRELLADGAQCWAARDVSPATFIEPSGSAQWYIAFLGLTRPGQAWKSARSC